MTAVLAENLYKAVRSVKQSYKIKPLPILNYIHIYSYEGWLKVETLDFEKPLQAKCPARIDTDLDTCVPMKAFIDYLRIDSKEIKALSLSFDPQTLRLTVTSESKGLRSKAQFVCMSSNDFPPLGVL